MRRPPSALFLALVLARPAAAQTTRDTVLANGLQVFVAENHRLPEATVVVAVRTGAFTQEAGQDGVAHMFEHLLFRAYPKGETAFNRETSFIDAGYNGETTGDYVDYFLEAPANHASDAVKILARLVRNGRFSESDLKAERPIVLDELARGASDPQSLLERRVSERLWGPIWNRVDVGGDSASVSSLSVATVQSQYTRYYVPNNMALIVSGDVSVRDIWKTASDAFGDWARSADVPTPHIDYPELPQSAFLLLAAPVSDVTILVATQGPPDAPDDTDAVPVEMMTAVLGNAASAFQSRLVGSGLFTSVRCRYLGHRHDGQIEFRGRTTVERGQKAVLTLLNELNVLDAMTGLADEDLGYARRSTAVTDALAAEEPSGLAEALASWWGGPGIPAYDAFDGRLAHVRLADVARVAGTYVAHRNRVIGIVAPRQFLVELQGRLAGGGQP
ncbi:MAG TPA: pitrilysin family protein [Gemmatimonadales bacterium]|nr:pitrilysin family protein [Gemmatimonadales bacterium]